jgi:gliding motility-associated lipoprotein GldH
MKKIVLYLLPALWLACTACDRGYVFEQAKEIQGNEWYIDSVAVFNVNIPSTSQGYDLYYTLRNSLDYPYFNMYITLYIEDSTGTPIDSRLHEMTLMDSRTGKPFGGSPLGAGFSNIYDHQFIALQGYRFPYAGRYTMRLKQYMRRDPLPGVYSVGLQIAEEGSQQR